MPRRVSESVVKARWLDFADRLRTIGLGIFNRNKVTVTDQESADVKVLGLMLLARTLSNLKAALTLVDGGRSLSRCRRNDDSQKQLNNAPTI